MESHLLDIIVCPLCKGPLHYDRPAQELICRADKLAFPVRDGIPVMLESEARSVIASASATASSDSFPESPSDSADDPA